MAEKHYKYLNFLTGMFVTMLLLSNLLSSAKIIDLGTSLGPIPLIFDAGTLIFPISYIFGDILTEVYGYKNARRVIWTGFLALALMGFFVWLAEQLPGETLWKQYAGDDAYNAILGGVSGLIVASIAAYFMGAFMNSYVLARMKILTRGRWIWARTIGSTMAGQAVDTISFFVIATAFGVFPTESFVALVVTNYIFKVGVEVIMTPITLWVIRWLKKAENEDFYDYETHFSPFRLDS
jgi:hypothetical protein